MTIKKIKGYGEKYFIDVYGNVYNKNKKLKIFEEHGYKSLCFSVNGKAKRVYVHRLLAIAFIPNPLNKPEVNHIDGNRKNNKLSNLEWVTHSENIKHAVDTGLFVHATGLKNGKCRISKEDINHIRAVWDNRKQLSEECGFRVTCKHISDMYNITYTYANRIVNRRVRIKHDD